MHSKAQAQSADLCATRNRSISIFAVTLTLFLLTLSLVAAAQNSVPPTARQAATMPQFAARLARGASRVRHTAQPSASYKKPTDWRSGRGWLPQQNEIYDNGPIKGATDGWAINYGFAVSDTFTVTGTNGATVTGLTFGAWLFPGDVAQSVEISITSSEFGGTTYFDGVVSFTQSDCSINQYDYNICVETSAGFNGPSLNSGTYWVNLQNAVVNDGSPLYWDENSGAGCESSGCPSLAEQTSIGTIPSEAFTITGNTNGCQFDCPPECVHDVPRDSFTIVHDFARSGPSPAPGLAFDQAGNLYGASGFGGSDGFGLDFKLTSIADNWIFDPLYSFTGGAGGQNPLPGIIGPEGAVYGTADGGLQNCGSSGTDYCGVVYKLRPSPTVCLTALCSWTQTVVYQFTGDPDGWKPNGNLVFDRAGNLYGTTLNGGAYGHGTVYELTPSNGGWTGHVIYSFTANDGDGPNALLMGHDGNLYGSTFYAYPSHGGGGIFQLAPSGQGWTYQEIAGFAPCTSYYDCVPILVQESSGKLYGIDPYDVYICPAGCLWNKYATIFSLSPSDNGWQMSVLDDTRDYWFNNWLDPTGYDVYYDLIVDAAGNVFTTEGGYTPGAGGQYFWGNVIKARGMDEDVFLVGFNGNNFRDLEAGANGKLYGTTGECGTSYGTVWQLTPP